MNFSLGSGVKHFALGYGIVHNENPDQAGKIQIKLENQNTIFSVHPSELTYQPTDIQGRIIKIGDLILFSVKEHHGAPIKQGKVEGIKEGKAPWGSISKITKLSVREDESGYLKSVSFPECCVVIDSPVIFNRK
jgi:hypothetical protein